MMPRDRRAPFCSMQDHRKLKVWQKADVLAVRVNDTVRFVKRRDRSGVASQASRAAFSIPSNIVEGCARPTSRDFARFLQIAIASACELEYQLKFAADTKLLSIQQTEPLRALAIEVRKMLYGLLRRVRDTQTGN